MISLGARVVETAEQALSIAEGKAKLAGIHEIETPDVAAIRKRQKLAQCAFVERYRLSVALARGWEQTKT